MHSDLYINQRFDAQEEIARECFQALNQRLDQLQSHVSELRGLSKRVSENSIRIEAIERQLTTADAPSSAD